MDEHVMLCEQLFTAAKGEFKHLVHLYFHNCPYETLYQDARMRSADSIATADVLNKYDHTWKLICIGDAAMSPYELLQPGGSISHWNPESGQIWLARLLQHYPKSVWINPVPAVHWEYSQSTKIIRKLFEDRMFGLTLEEGGGPGWRHAPIDAVVGTRRRSEQKATAREAKDAF